MIAINVCMNPLFMLHDRSIVQIHRSRPTTSQQFSKRLAQILLTSMPMLHSFNKGHTLWSPHFLKVKAYRKGLRLLPGINVANNLAWFISTVHLVDDCINYNFLGNVRCSDYRYSQIFKLKIVYNHSCMHACLWAHKL